MTFYPHARTGSNGIDGQIYGMGPEDNGYSWSQIWSGSCTISPDPSSNIASVYLRKCADNSGWCVLGRSITGFDTSSLPPGAVITSATLSIYGALKCMGGSYAPSINVYSASPASNTNLTNSDYLCLGSTPYCSTPISYTNFSVTGYNDFVLNAAGLSAINKNGVTNFGWREVGSDVANTPQDCVYSPPSVLRFYTADQGGGYAPKLVINYTCGTPSETYTYNYNGNPYYLGAGWDQQFRGWNIVTETDAANNTVNHYFFTTGTIGGKDAEKLTGKEYFTQYCDSK